MGSRAGRARSGSWQEPGEIRHVQTSTAAVLSFFAASKALSFYRLVPRMTLFSINLISVLFRCVKLRDNEQCNGREAFVLVSLSHTAMGHPGFIGELPVGLCLISSRVIHWLPLCSKYQGNKRSVLGWGEGLGSDYSTNAMVVH